MTIKTIANGTEMTIAVAGRLDTTTAPELENTVKKLTDSVTVLLLDLEEMEYISSAGLRVLLSAQKQMNGKGKMIVKNVSAEVMEIFEITGFTDILTIK